MIKENAETNEKYQKRRESLSSFFRVLTVQDVGSSFEQVLDADQNGGVFIVFPDVPLIKLPDLNQIFMIPWLILAKLVILICPKWNRLNGSYILWILIAFIFLLLHMLISLIFE